MVRFSLLQPDVARTWKSTVWCCCQVRHGEWDYVICVYNRYDSKNGHVIGVYDSVARYDKKKGFYCSSDGGKPRCLGPSKGRHYSPMPESDRVFLRNYYRPHNRKLFNMLRQLTRAPPRWLDEVPWVTCLMSYC